jgi:hypothetical protein
MICAENGIAKHCRGLELKTDVSNAQTSIVAARRVSRRDGQQFNDVGLMTPHGTISVVRSAHMERARAM